MNKGDVVRITREVDAHWLEGERNGKTGIFPASYVQIESEFERARQKLRVVYPFTARNSNELNLKRVGVVLMNSSENEWMSLRENSWYSVERSTRTGWRARIRSARSAYSPRLTCASRRPTSRCSLCPIWTTSSLAVPLPGQRLPRSRALQPFPFLCQWRIPPTINTPTQWGTFDSSRPPSSHPFKCLFRFSSNLSIPLLIIREKRKS